MRNQLKRKQTRLRVSFITKKTSNRLKVSEDIFDKWRSCELISALFSNIGIITSMLDYEINYSINRTHHNCHELEDHRVYGMITLFTSLIAIIFLILKHVHKGIWIDYQRETEKILNKSGNKSYSTTYSVKEKNSKFWLRAFEIAILCIFPYPYLKEYVYLPIRYNFEDYLICYTVNEFLYVFMFIRFFFLFKALSNYTIYKDHLARRYCTFYRTKADAIFSFKCITSRYPLLIVIAFIGIPSLIITGLMIRVFERPVDDITGQDFQDPSNGI